MLARFSDLNHLDYRSPKVLNSSSHPTEDRRPCLSPLGNPHALTPLSPHNHRYPTKWRLSIPTLLPLRCSSSLPSPTRSAASSYLATSAPKPTPSSPPCRPCGSLFMAVC